MPRTVQELRTRLREAEELLRAIQGGGVDALVVSGPNGDQAYTPSGAEHPYRVMVETMSEGAVILVGDGTIFYANRGFVAMVDMPLDDVIGSKLSGFVFAEDVPCFHSLTRENGGGVRRAEIRLIARGGTVVPVQVSISSFDSGTPGSACAVITNLTEHKRHRELISAEALERAKRAEVEEGHRRITRVLESITDSFFSVDREWRITDANQRAAANFGMRRDELIGASFWELFPEGRFPDVDEQYRIVMDHRAVVHVEGPSSIGRGRWFESHIYPIDEGLAVYFRDITGRRESEVALRASEERFRRAFDLGVIGMALTSPSKGCLEVNDELCRLVGYEREELLHIAWPDITHPDDLAADLAGFNRVMAGQIDSYSFEKRWIRKDGRIIETIMAARCVRRDDGSVDYFIALVQDITERKRAEAELRRSEANLAEAQRLTHTGSWALNVSTREVFGSLEYYRICGIDSKAGSIPRARAEQAVHPLDRFAAIEAFEKAFDRKGEFDHECRIARADGTIRYIHSIAHPVCNAAGAVIEYVGMIMDVTERKEADDERALLMRQVVQAQEDERRRIALEMHDQFGQQLSALVLKLSALRRELGPRTDVGQQVASLETATRQLDADLELIVSQLRPPALDDLGLLPALTNFVERWSEDFHIQAKLHASGIESDGLSDEIDTSLYRITQEALTNVARHAQARSVAILLSKRLDRVSLIVEDDGIGFVAESKGRRTRSGMSGMRERAKLLGGTVDVESRVGKGTTVVVRIPMRSNSSGSRHG